MAPPVVFFLSLINDFLLDELETFVGVISSWVIFSRNFHHSKKSTS
jgi:hypothetical protein